MPSGVQIIGLNLNELRARLAKMTDRQLREFGKAARYMVSPQANMGTPPLLIYEVQLDALTAEWRRRHPSKTNERNQKDRC
jgi:hypothetical protein